LATCPPDLVGDDMWRWKAANGHRQRLAELLAAARPLIGGGDCWEWPRGEPQARLVAEPRLVGLTCGAGAVQVAGPAVRVAAGHRPPTHPARAAARLRQCGARLHAELRGATTEWRAAECHVRGCPLCEQKAAHRRAAAAHRRAVALAAAGCELWLLTWTMPQPQIVPAPRPGRPDYLGPAVTAADIERGWLGEALRAGEARPAGPGGAGEGLDRLRAAQAAWRATAAGRRCLAQIAAYWAAAETTGGECADPECPAHVRGHCLAGPRGSYARCPDRGRCPAHSARRCSRRGPWRPRWHTHEHWAVALLPGADGSAWAEDWRKTWQYHQGGLVLQAAARRGSGPELVAEATKYSAKTAHLTDAQVLALWAEWRGRRLARRGGLGAAGSRLGRLAEALRGGAAAAPTPEGRAAAAWVSVDPAPRPPSIRLWRAVEVGEQPAQHLPSGLPELAEGRPWSPPHGWRSARARWRLAGWGLGPLSARDLGAEGRWRDSPADRRPAGEQLYRLVSAGWLRRRLAEERGEAERARISPEQIEARVAGLRATLFLEVDGRWRRCRPRLARIYYGKKKRWTGDPG